MKLERGCGVLLVWAGWMGHKGKGAFGPKGFLYSSSAQCYMTTYDVAYCKYYLHCIILYGHIHIITRLDLFALFANLARMAGGEIVLTPLKSLRTSSHQIPLFNRLPNTSIQHKPLLHYHSAFPSSISASKIESHLGSVGAVTPQWRYTMFSTTHFHSTTHEVLCISSGKAKLCFGGEENPKRVEVEAMAGDVLIVPAGVGHRLLNDAQGGFEMVGSYPTGKSWDMCYGNEGEEDKVKGIEMLGWFEKDPIYGDAGPVLEV